MAYKQSPKSPALKALIGNQKNLPDALKKKILAAPESMAKQTRGMVKLFEPLAEGELVKELTQEERMEIAKKKAAARKKAAEKRAQAGRSSSTTKNIKPAKKRKKKPIVVERPGKEPIAKPIQKEK